MVGVYGIHRHRVMYGERDVLSAPQPLGQWCWLKFKWPCTPPSPEQQSSAPPPREGGRVAVALCCDPLEGQDPLSVACQVQDVVAFSTRRGS